MSQLLYQYFLKKTNLDSLIKIGPNEDPYFEEIPPNELHFYQKKGAKRRRKLPDCISPHDLKVLNSVKRKAYRLDLQLSLCGLRIGWAGIIGLIPWVGDIIAVMFAVQLLNKADEIDGGLPPHLKQRMKANILMDFGIGLIPIVGDFINVMYKCNSRNFILLQKHLVEEYSKGDHTKSAIATKPATDTKPAVVTKPTTNAPKPPPRNGNTAPIPPPRGEAQISGIIQDGKHHVTDDLV